MAIRAVLLLLATLGDPAEEADEKLLQDAGVKVDGPSLVTFFQRRIPRAEDEQRLRQLINQLGNDRFPLREKASRELIALGTPALKALRTAIVNLDREVVRRARACIAAIENDSELPGVAARVLARKAPGGAVAALLACLPFADGEFVEEEMLAALAVLAARPGKVEPALIDAARDPEPARRGASAFVLGRHADRDQRELAVKLLSDPSYLVRFRAAQGVLAGKDPRAVPKLIDLLADAPAELAQRAEEMLLLLAREEAPASPFKQATPDSRREHREAWARWWTSHAKNVDLARLTDQHPQFGYTIIAQSNKVFEWDRAGHVRWTLGDVNMPIEALMLPNGHVLITENAGQRVTERDLTGKIHWEYKTPDQALSGRRLPNGNTFISTNSSVSEVTRDGKQVYLHRFPQGGGGSRINCACKLRNGRILVLTDGGNMDEVDAGTGKVLVAHQAPDRSSYSVEALPGGGWLLAAYGSGKVIEYNAAGQSVWEQKLQSAFHATRLPNGNTLIASYSVKRVVEVNRSGETVWEKQADNLLWRAHRR